MSILQSLSVISLLSTKHLIQRVTWASRVRKLNTSRIYLNYILRYIWTVFFCAGATERSLGLWPASSPKAWKRLFLDSSLTCGKWPVGTLGTWCLRRLRLGASGRGPNMGPRRGTHGPSWKRQQASWARAPTAIKVTPTMQRRFVMLLIKLLGFQSRLTDSCYFNLAWSNLRSYTNSTEMIKSLLGDRTPICFGDVLKHWKSEVFLLEKLPSNSNISRCRTLKRVYNYQRQVGGVL